MKRNILIFLLLAFSQSQFAQDVNLCLPLNGITSTSPFVKKTLDGWLLFENFFMSSEGSLGNTKVTKINTAGEVEWTFVPETMNNEGLVFSSAEPIADGRMLIVGNYSTCTSFSRYNIIIMLGADGRVLWTKTLEPADIQPLNAFLPYQISIAADGKSAWLSGRGSIYYYILKMDLSNSNITYISQPYILATQVKCLPGTDNQSLRIEYNGCLSLYQDTTLQQVIVGPGELGLAIYNVKVYETEPKIAASVDNGDILLMTLSGDTTLIRDGHTYDFDLKNGSELIALRYLAVDDAIVPGLKTKREMAMYSGDDFSQYRQISLPDFGQTFDSKRIFWNGDKVLLPGMHVTGKIDNFVQEYSFFERGRSSRHGVLMTFDPATPELTQLPVTDAGISDLKINDQSCWWNADTLSARYFKARDVQVQVTNRGNTPLHSFQLCSRSFYPLEGLCYEDIAFSRRYDGLNIAPGESYTVLIPELPLAITNPYLADDKIDSLCFWLTLPNDQLDTNFWNDCYCINPLKRQLPDPDALRVFPNPVQDQLFISIPDKGARKIDYQISSVTGQVIQEGLGTLEGQYYTIDTRPLSAGVYFLRMKGGTTRFVKY